MGREHDVVKAAQGRVGRQRLGLEHVERGAADPLLLERPDEGRLVDQPAARGVDELRRRASSARAGVDQVARLGGLHGRDEIGPAQQLVEPTSGSRAGPPCRPRRPGLNQHLHVEAEAALRQARPIRPKPTMPAQASFSRPWNRLPQRPLRTRRSYSTTRCAAAAIKRHGVVGHRVVVGAERHRDRRPVPGRGGHVDLVVAHAHPGDHLEPRAKPRTPARCTARSLRSWPRRRPAARSARPR